jgi:hypothetical protein
MPEFHHLLGIKDRARNHFWALKTYHSLSASFDRPRPVAHPFQLAPVPPVNPLV